jgi:hypothetical protein
MVMSRRGKKAAVLSGLIALAAVIVFAFTSSGFIAEYHYLRLRFEPMLLLEAIRTPEVSLRQRGLDKYLETEDGQAFLLDLFVHLFLGDFLPARAETFQADVTKGDVEFSVGDKNGGAVAAGGTGFGINPRFEFGSQAHITVSDIEALAARVSRLRGLTRASSRHPGWRFTVSKESPEGTYPFSISGERAK